MPFHPCPGLYKIGVSADFVCGSVRLLIRAEPQAYARGAVNRKVTVRAQIVCCHGLARSPAPHKIRDNIKNGNSEVDYFAF